MGSYFRHYLPEGKSLNFYYIDPSLEGHMFDLCGKDYVVDWPHFKTTKVKGRFDISRIPYSSVEGMRLNKYVPERIKAADGSLAPYSRRFLVNVSFSYCDVLSYSKRRNIRIALTPSTYDPYVISPYGAHNYMDYENNPLEWNSTFKWDELHTAIHPMVSLSAIMTLDRRVPDIGIKTYFLLSKEEGSLYMGFSTTNNAITITELVPVYDPDPIEGEVEIPDSGLTPFDLRGLTDAGLEDEALQESIYSANGLILNTIINQELDTNTMAYIELYLSAHYAWLEEQYRTSTPPDQRVVTGPKPNCYYKGLSSSKWGRKAMELDTTGTLAKMPCV